MMRKGMGYFAGLIALYIGVSQYTGSGKLITDGSNGFATVTKALQGRG